VYPSRLLRTPELARPRPADPPPHPPSVCSVGASCNASESSGPARRHARPDRLSLRRRSRRRSGFRADARAVPARRRTAAQLRRAGAAARVRPGGDLLCLVERLGLGSPVPHSRSVRFGPRHSNAIRRSDSDTASRPRTDRVRTPGRRRAADRHVARRAGGGGPAARRRRAPPRDEEGSGFPHWCESRPGSRTCRFAGSRERERRLAPVRELARSEPAGQVVKAGRGLQHRDTHTHTSRHREAAPSQRQRPLCSQDGCVSGDAQRGVCPG
jgi:hypothetical protein